VFLLERMLMAMDALGQGRDAWLDRVNALMGEVTTGTFSLAQAAIRQRQAGPILMLPARLAATLLKSVLAGSGDLLKISGGTAWRFMAGFIAPENTQARKPMVSKTRPNPGSQLPPATAQTPSG
jgi:hypothetical protein